MDPTFDRNEEDSSFECVIGFFKVYIGSSGSRWYRSSFCIQGPIMLRAYGRHSEEATPELRSPCICPKENLKGYRECASSVVVY